ncbi:MAG: hypothetical protein J07HQW2_00506 [Haloquadratum walsbyi J07HQW2]|uniref:Uncharacterized protein n=1 Tax=Haloquadratum walsbyi J07HQW2 TaxID=1238425 RepID=U1PK68_9EURY|nr:MAG: hypothetical protein J07HQW2_00506 [Haloquadratum walsbyi J07HQW2]
MYLLHCLTHGESLIRSNHIVWPASIGLFWCTKPVALAVTSVATRWRRLPSRDVNLAELSAEWLGVTMI